MPTGSVLGLTAKLGIETDDRQVEKETRSLKNKLSDAAEAEMTADIDTLKGDISSAIESASEDAKWIPDSLSSALAGAIGGSVSVNSMFSEQERGRLTRQMEALGHDVPDRLGGGGGGGAAAGAVAGDMFGGMKGAGGKFLKVGLAGAVGLGILSKVTSMSDAAPRMSKTLSMLNRSVRLFARPFFDFLARFLEGGAKNLLDMAANFNEIYAEDGLLVAISKLPELFFTRGGETSKAGTAGRVAGGLGGMVAGGAAGAKGGMMAGGAIGSIIPGAGTGVGATGGAILGGAAGGLGGLLGGAELGEWAAEGLKSAFGDLSQWVDSGLGSLSQWVDSGIGDLSQWVDNGLGSLSQWVDDGIGDLSQWVDDGIGDLTNWVDDGIGDLDRWIDDGLGDLSAWVDEGLGDLSRWVDRGLGNLSGWVDRGLGDLSGWVDNGIGDLDVWVNRGIGDLDEWVDDGVGDLSGWVDGGLGSLSSWVDSGLGSLSSWVDSGLGSLSGWVTSGLGSLDDYIPEWTSWDPLDYMSTWSWNPLDYIKLPGGGSDEDAEEKAEEGDIPSPTPMATGGLVTSPTETLVGEAGPEVVAPFDEFNDTLARAAAEGQRRGGSDPSDDGMERVVNAIEGLHAELKRLDPQVELKVDRKTLAKEEQKGLNRYRNSRVVSK